MKDNSLRTVLEWVLITSLVLSSYFFIRLYFQTHQYRALSLELAGQQMKLQYMQPVIPPLINDVVEYSKHNPAVLPILEIVGYKPVSNAPATSVPGASPRPAK